MKDFNFTLQIKGEENKVIGNIVQNDTANRFIIRLRDGISPVVLDETDIVTVTYKRSNDTVVVDAMGGETIEVADYEKGEIIIVPDNAAVQNVGIVNATVEIYDAAGKKLSSARFSFTVTPDLAGHADASTDSSFPALQNLITLLATKNDGWENAEAQRVANENVRVTNEDGRVTAEQERAQVWAQLEEMCRQLIKEMVSPDVKVKTSTPEEYILTITDKDGTIETPNLKAGQGAGTGDMLMADYDSDKDGSVNRADVSADSEKLDGHEAGYFSTFRDCSNVPFNEIASVKGVFFITWSSPNSPNANALFGISDGWTAIAMSYTGEIYITTIEKTSWEKQSVSINGGAFTGNVAVTGLLNILGSSWNALQFKTTDNKSRGSVMISNNNRIHFNQGETGATYQERYQLPAITSGLTADKWYEIMTSRGGAFTGNTKAYSDLTADYRLRNACVVNSAWDYMATDSLVFVRK